MKFTSDFVIRLNKKAWALYREIKGTATNLNHLRDIRRHCFKVAYKALKAGKDGVVKFFKIGQSEDTVEVRRVMNLEDFGYQSKTDRKVKPTQFLFIDLDKFFAGIPNPIISVNHSNFL